MTQGRHLPNAPIREAILDLRVTLPQGADADVCDLHRLTRAVATSYPAVEELVMFASSLRIERGSVAGQSTESRPAGYICRSADGLQVVQFSTTGFTFNRLRPYETWEAMRDEAQRLWKAYADVAKPEIVNRVGVRFINELEIPDDKAARLSDYLVSAPVIPEGVPPDPLSFLDRILVEKEPHGARAAITQAGEMIGDRRVIILDIDAFREFPFGTGAEPAWRAIEALRHFKNDIFFATLTDRALGMFE